MSSPKRLPNGTVEQTERGFRLHAWHPQWGGYSSQAFVDFDETSGDSSGEPGCFELTVWHDGEFPISEERANDPRTEPSEAEPFTFHHCGAMQHVYFGLDVLDAQVAHQLALDGSKVVVDTDEIDEAIRRLTALKEEMSKRTGS